MMHNLLGVKQGGQLLVESSVFSVFHSSLLATVQQRSALAARHGAEIVCGDPFYLGPMSSLFVARIAQHHAILVEGV
jgi:hypothetical protein